MWYNVDVLKRQHDSFRDYQHSELHFVNVEHSSGDVLISFVGRKSGLEYRFSDRHQIYVDQAPYLTMRITMSKMADKYPDLVCYRRSYTGTTFEISDKTYADEVLTRIFTEYDPPASMKDYFLKMFDDWNGYVKLDHQHETQRPFEPIVLGEKCDMKHVESPTPNTFLTRIFNFKSNLFSKKRI